ncbi:MAG: hypothetical protein GY757_46420 [bacterium]|nr:hypothetical protein [bacterium]
MDSLSTILRREKGRDELRRLYLFGFLFLLMAVVSLHPLFSLDPNRELSQYMHDSWGMEEGLPQNSVMSILQTGAGYLWVGTKKGLARFNGRELAVFDYSHLKGLKSENIRTLTEDRNKRVWLGAWGGVGFHENGTGLWCQANFRLVPFDGIERKVPKPFGGIERKGPKPFDGIERFLDFPMQNM